MFIKITAAFFALVLWINSLPSETLAAELQVFSTQAIPLSAISAGGCSVQLSGRIEKGDLQKLESLMDEKLELGMPTWLYLDEETDGPPITTHALCLDSPGGDLSEALRIAERLDWPMVVPKGARCLSACALLFLSGSLTSSNSSGGARIPFRVLDISAKLGFHAPFTNLSQIPSGLPRSAIADFVNEFYATGLSTIGLINQKIRKFDSYSAVDRLPTSLLVKMIETRGAENFFYIDSIDKAGAMDIRLSGMPTIPITKDSYGRMCSNSMLWSSAAFSDGFEPDINSWAYWSHYPGTSEQLDTTTIPSFLLLHAGDGGMFSDQPVPDFTVQVTSRHITCTFYTHPGSNDDFSIYFRSDEGSSPVEFRTLEPWSSLPHYLRFEEILAMGEPFDVDSVLTRYGSIDEDGTGGRLKFNRLLKGFTVVMSDLETASSLAVYVASTGNGKVYKDDGTTVALSYVPDSSKNCFSVPEMGISKTCVVYSSGEYGDNLVRLPGVFPDFSVNFARPGDIGSLKDWRSFE